MKPNSTPKRDRLDWDAIRDRVDMAAVATRLLGPSPKRSGRRLLWHCPFHEDGDPSFQVDPDTHRWKCWPCDKGGDAAALVMQLEGVGFPEAVRRVAEQAGIVSPSTGRPVRAGWPDRGGASGPSRKGRAAKGSPSSRSRPRAPKASGFPAVGSTDPRPRAGAAPDSSSGLMPEEARGLVEESEARLWAPEGRPALAYLVTTRGLTEGAIRRHRLGWTPGVFLPTSDGIRYFRASGVVIPWFDGDRLSRVKIRQLDGRGPRYAQAFDDRARVYPGPSAIRPGSTLIVVEGEFDAMLLGQELGDLASVATFGGSSSRLDPVTMMAMCRCPIRLAAHDADPAGDRAATEWFGGSERVRPPAGKDWSDARSAGIDLRRWWIENYFPIAFDREERAAIMEFDGGLDREAAEAAAGMGGEK